MSNLFLLGSMIDVTVAVRGLLEDLLDYDRNNAIQPRRAMRRPCPKRLLAMPEEAELNRVRP